MVEKKISTAETDANNFNDSQIEDNLKPSKFLKQEKICGIVMPISPIDGLMESHWMEVKGIIESSILDAGFSANLVSDADEIGIIQKRIIQNLYDNPIVVCDVSCKNPNVMFELGLRLAFDKPTIIVKDDNTDYSFDTSVIEHLIYPRDLRFNQIVKFKSMLTTKIKATFEKSKDVDYSTFLKNFGTFKVAKLDEKEVSSEQFILERLNNIEKKIDIIKYSNSNNEKFDINLVEKHKLYNENFSLRLQVLKIRLDHNIKSDRHSALQKDIKNRIDEFINNFSFLKEYEVFILPSYVLIELKVLLSNEDARNAFQQALKDLISTVISGYENL